MTVQDTAQQTPADRFRVGIDIGGTKVEAVLVDPQDNVRNDVRIPARRGNAQVIDDVVSITHEVAGDLFDQVATVGIGIPGQVNPETGRVDNVVNLDIDTLELGAEAGKRLGIPVHVENDVNAAAVGAARMVGGSHPEGTIVFLNFGTGLAAGIVVDGVVQHGFSGAAGEIGHIPIDPNRFPCPCGQSGCLETVCSGASVGRHWPVEGKPPMPDLIECARRGEPDAQRILVMVTHAIVDAVQIVAQSYDPRMIIFGGGMAKTGQPLIDVTLDELRVRERTCPFLTGLHLGERIKLAQLDQPVGALGAAWAAPEA